MSNDAVGMVPHFFTVQGGPLIIVGSLNQELSGRNCQHCFIYSVLLSFVMGQKILPDRH